jgi:hypothetical protein
VATLVISDSGRHSVSVTGPGLDQVETGQRRGELLAVRKMIGDETLRYTRAPAVRLVCANTSPAVPAMPFDGTAAPFAAPQTSDIQRRVRIAVDEGVAGPHRQLATFAASGRLKAGTACCRPPAPTCCAG